MCIWNVWLDNNSYYLGNEMFGVEEYYGDIFVFEGWSEYCWRRNFFKRW